jgi:hypothetical protein
VDGRSPHAEAPTRHRWLNTCKLSPPVPWARYWLASAQLTGAATAPMHPPPEYPFPY